jgi:DNA-binding IclR family transcriptional regulator
MLRSKHNVPRGVTARYALILETVAVSSLGLSLTAITRGTGLSSATTHRLVNALVDIGYLTDDGSRKTYRIGHRLIRLFHLAHSPTTVSLLVQPILQGLVERFGETAFVAKLNGNVVESIASAAPENYDQSHVQPGRVMPINAAASAKVIFAYQSEFVITEALAAPLHKYTERTIIDTATLRQNLEEVRAHGYAKCADELDPGVLSYACPIHLPSAGVLYSIGIVALSRRLTSFAEADVIAALSNAARLASTRLCEEFEFVDTDTIATRRAASGR